MFLEFLLRHSREGRDEAASVAVAEVVARKQEILVDTVFNGIDLGPYLLDTPVEDLVGKCEIFLNLRARLQISRSVSTVKPGRGCTLATNVLHRGECIPYLLVRNFFIYFSDKEVFVERLRFDRWLNATLILDIVGQSVVKM